MLKTPLKKIRKSNLTFLQYYLYVSINYLLFFLFIFQHVNDVWFFAHSILLIPVIILPLILKNSDPGFIVKDKDVDFQAVLETNNLDKVCPECEILITCKIRHCKICNRCVDRYDHHCPWINN